MNGWWLEIYFVIVVDSNSGKKKISDLASSFVEHNYTEINLAIHKENEKVIIRLDNGENEPIDKIYIFDQLITSICNILDKYYFTYTVIENQHLDYSSAKGRSKTGSSLNNFE